MNFFIDHLTVLRRQALLISGVFLCGMFLLACGASPSSSFTCGTTDAPQVRAVLTALGEEIWSEGQSLPKQAIIGSAVQFRGDNLCTETISISDLLAETRPLAYEVVNDNVVQLELPWDMSQVNVAVIFRADINRSIVQCTLLDIDGEQRQLFVNQVTTD